MIQVVRPGEGLITIKEQDMKSNDTYFGVIEGQSQIKETDKIDLVDIKAKLKEKGVKFFAGAKEEKILEIAKENGII